MKNQRKTENKTETKKTLKNQNPNASQYIFIRRMQRKTDF